MTYTLLVGFVALGIFLVTFGAFCDSDLGNNLAQRLESSRLGLRLNLGSKEHRFVCNEAELFPKVCETYNSPQCRKQRNVSATNSQTSNLVFYCSFILVFYQIEKTSKLIFILYGHCK